MLEPNIEELYGTNALPTYTNSNQFPALAIDENNNVIQNIEQDDYIDDYEPDYEDLQNTYINQINQRINNIDLKIEKLIRSEEELKVSKQILRMYYPKL